MGWILVKPEIYFTFIRIFLGIPFLPVGEESETAPEVSPFWFFLVEGTNDTADGEPPRSRRQSVVNFFKLGNTENDVENGFANTDNRSRRRSVAEFFGIGASERETEV